MKLSAPVAKLINEQITNEYASAHAYLAMAAWLELTPYEGFANWMHMQCEEERVHAKKFYDYLLDRDGKISLGAIPKPRAQFKSVLDIFKTSLTMEQTVTRQIHKIYDAANKAKDYETINFLGWFLSEQVEEEKSMSTMIDKLELAGDDAPTLLRLSEQAMERSPEEE